MAGTDYTEKQLADHMAQFAKDGSLPDGSIYDPAAFARGGTTLRKMTAEERIEMGLPPATDPPEKKEG